MTTDTDTPLHWICAKHGRVEMVQVGPTTYRCSKCGTPPTDTDSSRGEALALTKAIESLTAQAAVNPTTFHLTNECGRAILAALSPIPQTEGSGLA